ncbi:MAG: ABC transporter permease [Synergistaceae bacterium]|nr:ABC transporter permease [Synergistaceae bacterium]
MSDLGKKKYGGLWARFRKNRMALFGGIMITGLAVVAVFAPWIAPFPYDEQDFMVAQEPPSRDHWFGTDEFGRDIFSRIVYASRISLEVGFIAVSIGMFVGGMLGSIAGYYGQRLDNMIMRAMDILLAVPSTILAIAIAATLGPGLFNLMLAVGISTIPRYARIVRASVLSIRHLEFIEAAKAVGSSDLRIIAKHILPNCLAPVIVQATLGVASAILNTAGLSFIGLGIQPPTPEWGAMLSGARTYIRDYPYMMISPGLAIMITVLALNFLGDGLRDALDPKLKR